MKRSDVVQVTMMSLRSVALRKIVCRSHVQTQLARHPLRVALAALSQCVEREDGIELTDTGERAELAPSLLAAPTDRGHGGILACEVPRGPTAVAAAVRRLVMAIESRTANGCPESKSKRMRTPWMVGRAASRGVVWKIGVHFCRDRRAGSPHSGTLDVKAAARYVNTQHFWQHGQTFGVPSERLLHRVGALVDSEQLRDVVPGEDQRSGVAALAASTGMRGQRHPVERIDPRGSSHCGVDAVER